MVFAWEFNLRFDLSVVQSRALTFDPELVKNIKKAPNLSQKRPVTHQIIVVHAQVPYFSRYDIFCFSKLKALSNRLLLV